MKLNPPIKCDDGTILEEVNPTDSGVYCIFRIPNVKRGIRGKSRGKVDELLIVGVPHAKANQFLRKYGIRIKRE